MKKYLWRHKFMILLGLDILSLGLIVAHFTLFEDYNILSYALIPTLLGYPLALFGATEQIEIIFKNS